MNFYTEYTRKGKRFNGGERGERGEERRVE
jgi:hypothetical protein